MATTPSSSSASRPHSLQTESTQKYAHQDPDQRLLAALRRGLTPHRTVAEYLVNRLSEERRPEALYTLLCCADRLPPTALAAPLIMGACTCLSQSDHLFLRITGYRWLLKIHHVEASYQLHARRVLKGAMGEETLAGQRWLLKHFYKEA